MEDVKITDGPLYYTTYEGSFSFSFSQGRKFPHYEKWKHDSIHTKDTIKKHDIPVVTMYLGMTILV
jgi:hypothetical protein